MDISFDYLWPLLLFGAAGSFGVFLSFVNHRFVLTFPTIFSVGVLAFLFPQALAIAQQPLAVPVDFYQKGMLYMVACMVFGYFGYFQKPTTNISVPRWRYDTDVLFLFGAFLILVGVSAQVVLGFYMGGFLNQYTDSFGSYAIEWRGAPVYIVFFTRFVWPGLFLMLAVHLLRPSAKSLLFLAIGLFYPFMNVLFLGRRSDFAKLVALFAFSLYFFRGYLPTRKMMLAGLVVFALVIVLFPAYRAGMQIDDDWSELREVDAGQQVTEFVGDEKTNYELRYALLKIGIIDDPADLRWGTGFWNAFVRQFVPRGLVGEDFKYNLMVQEKVAERILLVKYGIETPSYMTPTGLGSSFTEFGYLGVLLYYFAGRFFRLLNEHAWRGSQRAALFGVALAVLPALIVYGGWGNLIIRWTVLLIPVVIIDRLARIPMAPEPGRVRMPGFALSPSRLVRAE